MEKVILPSVPESRYVLNDGLEENRSKSYIVIFNQMGFYLYFPPKNEWKLKWVKTEN